MNLAIPISYFLSTTPFFTILSPISSSQKAMVLKSILKLLMYEIHNVHKMH